MDTTPPAPQPEQPAPAASPDTRKPRPTPSQSDGERIALDLETPYPAFDTRELLHSPAPERIEHYAYQLLARAFHTARLTAFVGSGASMAYGRIGWSEMLYAAQQRALAKYEKRQSEIAGRPAAETDADKRATEIENILDKVAIKRNSSTDASSHLAVFQLSEDLDNAVSSAASSGSDNAGAMPFRQTVMWVTRDHRGHAERLLSDAMSDGSLPSDRDDDLVAAGLWGGTATPIAGRRIPLPEGAKRFEKAADFENQRTRIEQLWDLKKPERFENDAREDVYRLFTLPSERHRVAAWLHSLDRQVRKKVFEELCEHIEALRKPRLLPDGKPAPDPERKWHEREWLVHPERDPLKVLHGELGICRFVTTNYDHEIERLFSSLRYRHEQGTKLRNDSSTEVNPLARSYRDIVLGPEWIGHVSALSTSGASRNCYVVHLHGRGEEDNTGSIVATEEDYQKHYARNDAVRPLLDDAVRLVFTAEPLLFVGIGMDEIDLLRPLREFMGTSQNALEPDRVAVALLPGEGTRAKITARKIDLLRRYGVYTIHYGHAEFDDRPGTSHWAGTGTRRADSPPGIQFPYSKDVSKRPELVDNLLKYKGKAPQQDDLATADTWLQCLAELKSDFDEISAGFDNIDELRRKSSSKTDEEWKDFRDNTRPKIGQLYKHLCGAADKGYWRGSGLAVPKRIERQNTDDFELATELCDMSNVLTAGLALHDALDGPNKFARSEIERWEAIRRSLQGYRVLLAGAYTAIKTVCLCAALRRIQQRTADWTNCWRGLPKPRIPPHKIHAPPTSQFRMIERHPVYLLPEPHGKEAEKHYLFRFYSGAPSQTFNTLLSALEHSGVHFPPISGRRVFLFLARPGLGKGHFFAALQSDARRSELLKNLGIDATCNAAAFLNLSFSLELSSVFDRLSDFFANLLLERKPADEHRLTQSFASLKHSRIERLRFIMKELAQRDDRSSRILVAVNGINMLFDANGRPKNRQLGELFEILLADFEVDGVKDKQPPIDLVLVCSEAAVPWVFRGAAARAHPRVINRKHISTKGELAVQKRLAELDIVTAKTGNVFVHLLHEARASVMLAAFFPTLAVALACCLVPNSHRPKGQLRENVLHPDFARRVRTAIQNLLSGDQDDALHREQKHVIPYVVAAAAICLRRRTKTFEEVLSCLKSNRDSITGADRKKIGEDIVKLMSGQDSGFPSEPDFSRIAADFDDLTRRMFQAVGRGRYSLTLLMATAYEILFSKIPAGKSGLNANQLDAFDEGCREVHSFILSFLTRLELLQAPARENAVIEEAFTKHETLLSTGLGFSQFRGIDEEFEEKQHKIFNIQQWILWHLAVIGLPVTAAVLAECPLIRQAVANAGVDITADGAIVLNKVKAVLKVMTARCLVFWIRPNRGDEPSGRTAASAGAPALDSAAGKPAPVSPSADAPAKEEEDEDHRRYSIHRAVQRNIFARMGAPFVNYVEVDRFSLSLYASQPNDLPVLTPESHRQLRDTVAALLKHVAEKKVAAIGKLDPVHLLRRDMLRAAYGILRSVYSVASLARFGIEHETGREPAVPAYARPGIFEEHRLQLWALIDEARKISKREKPDWPEDSADPPPENAHRPFYAEEIAWLYNEAGVVSLAEGRLQDAFDLFDLALRAVGTIEQDQDGPLSTLINLNRALVDIERGNMARARRALEQIRAGSHRDPDGGKAPEDKSRRSMDNPVEGHPDEVFAIATGYLGLVEHLTGNLTAATKRYEEAVPQLVKLKKLRAASLLSRHWGDLERASATPGSSGVNSKIRSALQLAQEGSQEDARHLAILSEARAMLLKTNAEGAKEIHVRLDMVERYSLAMGMPRITCEAFEIRARLYRQLGDLRNATSVAREAKRIAAIQQMKVRLASVLSLYADIAQQQGFRHICAPIVDEAVSVAHETDYFAAYAEAQEIKHRIESGLPIPRVAAR